MQNEPHSPPTSLKRPPVPQQALKSPTMATYLCNTRRSSSPTSNSDPSNPQQHFHYHTTHSLTHPALPSALVFFNPAVLAAAPRRGPASVSFPSILGFIPFLASLPPTCHPPPSLPIRGHPRRADL